MPAKGCSAGRSEQGARRDVGAEPPGMSSDLPEKAAGARG